MSDQKWIDYVLVYKTREMASEDESGEGDSLEASSRKFSRLPRASHRVKVVGKGGYMYSTPMPIPDMQEAARAERRKARKTFHIRLKEAGLELEVVQAVENPRRHFVLIHAPHAILEKHAEIINVKRKMVLRKAQWFLGSYTHSILKMLCLCFRRKVEKTKDDDVSAPDVVFSPSDRALIVKDILSQTSYSSNRMDIRKVGVENMLSRRIYSNAFPLHEEYQKDEVNKENESSISQRTWLAARWSSWEAILKEQPLDVIRSYFGPKIALYFAWFGCYNRALIFLSVAGIIQWLPIDKLLKAIGIGGSVNLMHETVIPTQTCSQPNVKNIIICPQCVQHCDFQTLHSLCHPWGNTISDVELDIPVYTSHGLSAVFYSLFTCVWAAIFIRMWKRNQTSLAHRWSLSEHLHEQEMLRPEFARTTGIRRLNAVTGRSEPTHSAAHTAWVFALHTITIMLMLLLVGSVNLGCHLLKYQLRSWLVSLLNQSLDRFRIYLAGMAAAGLHSLLILLLNWMFEVVCGWIVEWENPRTQRQFDDRYAMKMFIFQFLDYFVPLFYIVFVRTAVSIATLWNPANPSWWRNIVTDTCSHTCFEELDQSMIVFFCGTQIGREVVKFIWPILFGCLRRFFLSSQRRENLPHWEEDFYLPPPHTQQLCYDHLRLAIQFAFLVIFAPSFHLAPLLALIVNAISLRNDAKRLTLRSQRVTPSMTSSIGVWNNVLDILSTIAVPINAFILAFCTDIVPRYAFHWSGLFTNHTKYFDFAYSYYDASNVTIYHSTFTNVTRCRFYGLYHLPCSLFPDDPSCRQKYETRNEFEMIMIMRIMFMAVFVNIVYGSTWLLRKLISEEPKNIRIERQRERYQAQLALSAVVNARPSNTNKSPPCRSLSHSDGRRSLLQSPRNLDEELTAFSQWNSGVDPNEESRGSPDDDDAESRSGQDT